MNPRAIALQGIGFGALLVAVQGFSVVDPIQPTTVFETYSPDDSRSRSIDQQNKALIHLLAAFVSSGALE